jgi:hypothetical protein
MINLADLKKLITYDTEAGDMYWVKSGKFAGCKRKDGYVVIRLNGTLYYRHRLAWLYVYGVEPTYTIDHINVIKGDDRLINLRDVPFIVNAQNRKKAPKSNKSSGYIGVQRNRDKWQAHITTSGKRMMLGTYATPQEAHQRYIEAKRRLHKGCTI